MFVSYVCACRSCFSSACLTALRSICQRRLVFDLLIRIGNRYTHTHIQIHTQIYIYIDNYERKRKTNEIFFLFYFLLDSMSRPLFRALTLDPNKRILLLIDQHDDNNNDLPHPHSTSSSSSNNLLVSYSSTSNLQTSQHSTVSNSRLPQRCAPQMPFVSGMEREEEEVYCRMIFVRFFFIVTISSFFRNITFKALSMLNVDSVQQRFVLYPFLMYTKIFIVKQYIQQMSIYLNNSFDYNVDIRYDRHVRPLLNELFSRHCFSAST